MTIRTQAYETLMRITCVFTALVATSVMADTEIHRCSQADGTVAFQEKPCAEPTAGTDEPSDASKNRGENETPVVKDDAFDFANPFDEPAGTPARGEPALPKRLSKDRAACEKTTRGAIDAINLKLQKSTSRPEQDRQQLAELLELTRQLRACKAL